MNLNFMQENWDLSKSYEIHDKLSGQIWKASGDSNYIIRNKVLKLYDYINLTKSGHFKICLEGMIISRSRDGQLCKLWVKTS